MKRVILLTVCIIFAVTSFCQHVDSQFPGRKIIKDSSWAISDRVTRQEIKYFDGDDKIVVVQIIKARLKKNKLLLEAATPNNSHLFGRQVVTDEMKAENTPHRLVLGGVNADFFNMNNGIPLGPVVKDGGIIKNADSSMVAFVGVLKSGKIIMGDSILFKKRARDIKEALGARPILLKKGQLLTQNNSSLSTVHHPRTALGLKGRHTVYFVTVDGRQPKFSNGISLSDLGKLMRWLGIENSVNLDGGGSTTMVIWDQKTSQYKISNQPSGKQLRPVANSWILVRKR
ncbi:Exopolysaccharide biosynthesis protein [Arachidicoccus rhizosphaerae]|uniref:Exopolysaccharide biosynthesis protein n=1 Tax=Arachidicoccus rhizosphaerae TaxID=551991 RepID=A0A1H3WJS9_9BACT|nr:phosphodiester glycosidase family protein [Arachidicoccus rhizosphaerae]SDZ87061.1 Exopolysaccharide biosynthesis protein [Arachidicoccus rhizosphaerae]